MDIDDDVGDLRQGLQALLDLAQFDAVTAELDLVVDAAEVAQFAVVALLDPVAGAVPALDAAEQVALDELLVGQRLALPVTAPELRAAHPQFADAADRRKFTVAIDHALLDVPEPAPRVQCDRTMVEQVLLNLTRNGIQAMEADTPVDERVLRLAVRQTHARWVHFSVTDAGPGIPPEVGMRLFTPFYTTRRDGMGLGLSLCRTVVEQHGGALSFEPALPRGTVFRFTLPADAGPALR